MWVFLFTVAGLAALVLGHGRVLDPPGRGTAWRAGFEARANYDDDGLNCGGFYHQHTVNGGKCGLCGDPYDSAQPRAHERGGIYDSNITVGTYDEGSLITITVEITAHHLGYWEFKLCPDADEPDQACFDDNILQLEDGSTKYYPTEGSTQYHVNYFLPKGITCEICVLQWRYTCGNNWGTCSNGTEGLGCGDQENFGACSDISIKSSTEVPQYIEVDSLLLDKVEEQDLVRLLLKAAAAYPHRPVQTNSIIPHKQRLNSKKPHTKDIDTEDPPKPHSNSHQPHTNSHQSHIDYEPSHTISESEPYTNSHQTNTKLPSSSQTSNSLDKISQAHTNPQKPVFFKYTNLNSYQPYTNLHQLHTNSHQLHIIPHQLYTIPHQLYTIPHQLYTIPHQLYTIPHQLYTNTKQPHNKPMFLHTKPNSENHKTIIKQRLKNKENKRIPRRIIWIASWR